jgi:hypothetical protein
VSFPPPKASLGLGTLERREALELGLNASFFIPVCHHGEE